MKGIVFSLKKSTSRKRSSGIGGLNFVYLFKRYGTLLLFVFLLLLGLVLGAVCASNADSQLLNSLDFLFTTNLEARLSHNAIGTFCACFASDFIFVILIFLFGIAPWGLPFQLFTVVFKGFGTGLTAAYLYISYGISGVGFYLLVLLPGTFLFCAALVIFSASAIAFSKNMFYYTVGKSVPVQSPRQELFGFCARFLRAFATAFFAALLDTVLWTLFAGTFNILS